MISYAFTAIFWAWALMQLFQKKILHRIVAVLLAVCLTITGIYDFVVIIRNNGPGHRISVNMNSDLTDWLEEHLTHEDLILTPEYSINEVTMSGVMMYMDGHIMRGRRDMILIIAQHRQRLFTVQ